jgi:hypothetical protein
MIDINKIHKYVTLFQVSIVLVLFMVSSLGIVSDHPILIYAWYLSLAGMGMVVLTSCLMGIVLGYVRFSRAFFSHKKIKGRYGWFTYPKCAQI